MNYAALIKAISAATTQLQGRAAAALNQALVIRNWMVGAWVIEFEQTGKDRAKYGERLLETLAHDLKERGLKGLDERSLLDCRSVYRLYPQIPGTLSPEFKELLKIRKTASAPAQHSRAVAIRGTLSRELPTALEPAQVLQLSWTQLQELIRIDDPWKRAFFENECLNSRWSVRQLQRQIGSLLYERTGLSANKKAVIERARKQAPQESIAGLLRDPYVLEFANLAALPAYTGNQLQSALLDHLQHFLLELGRGFCFEARKSNSPRPAWIKNCSSRAISLRCRRWRNCARFSKQTASGLKASCLWLAAQPGL